MLSPRWFKFLLALSAYFPLFFILIVKYFDLSLFSHLTQILSKSNLFFSVVLLSFFLLSLISSIYILLDMKIVQRSHSGAKVLTFVKFTNKDKDILVYLLTYTLPLISLSSNNFRDIIVLILLIIFILVLSYGTDVLYINPLLMLLKFHVYSGTTHNGEEVLLFSNKTHLHNLVGESKRICYRLEGEYILIDGEEEKS